MHESSIHPSSRNGKESVNGHRSKEAHDGRYRGNAHLDSTATRKHCAVGSSGKALLESALERMGLSARAYDKILRVARTLADLEEQDTIGDHHLAEAIQYRSLDLERY